MSFHYTDSKEVEREIENDEYTIYYRVVYVHDFYNDETFIDEIECLDIVDNNGDVISGFYDQHKDDIIKQMNDDASYYEPCDWSSPSWTDYCEARAEW